MSIENEKKVLIRKSRQHYKINEPNKYSRREKRKEPESIKCFSRVRRYLYLPMHIRSIEKFPIVSIPQIVGFRLLTKSLTV